MLKSLLCLSSEKMKEKRTGMKKKETEKVSSHTPSDSISLSQPENITLIDNFPALLCGYIHSHTQHPIQANQQQKVISKLVSSIRELVFIDTERQRQREGKWQEENEWRTRKMKSNWNCETGKTFNDISCALVFCFHSSIQWHFWSECMNENVWPCMVRAWLLACSVVSSSILFNITFSRIQFVVCVRALCT